MSSGNGVDAVRRPPEPADPVERLLKEWPELGAFGVDWLRTWAPRAEGCRMVGIAKVLRRYPWMAEGLRRRPVNPHPYMVEAYVAVDGSEACLSLNPPKAFAHERSREGGQAGAGV